MEIGLANYRETYQIVDGIKSVLIDLSCRSLYTCYIGLSSSFVECILHASALSGEDKSCQRVPTLHPDTSIGT